MKNWYYLSFVDRVNSRWVGACLVMAETPEGAVEEAWQFGVNGGGEVAILELANELKPRDGDSYRLITDPDEARGLKFEER